MADIKISQLTSYDPLADGYIFPISKQVNGVWKSGRVSSDTFANYVADDVLGKLEGVDAINIAKEDSTGKYLVKLNLDTNLYQVVTELPVTGATNKIYLVPDTNDSGDNVYIEYGYVDGKWEKMGEHKADTDLSGYMTTAAYEALNVDEAIADAKKAGTDAQTTANANANSISNLESKVTTVEGKVSTLETSVKTLETTVGDSTSGLVKAVADNKSAIEADAKDLADYKDTTDEAIKKLQTAIGGVATDENLKQLSETVAGHTTDIASINTALESYVKTTAMTEALSAKLDTTTASDTYVTKTVYNAHISEANESLDAKANKTDVYTRAEIDAKLASEGEDSVIKNFVTNAGVDSKIAELNLAETYAAKSLETTVANLSTTVETKADKSDLTGLATETYVNEKIAAADITSKLADYAKTADVESKIAIAKTALEKADSEIESELDAYKEKVSSLEEKIEKLEAIIAIYDARFERTVDEDNNTVWGKEFLVVE